MEAAFLRDLARRCRDMMVGARTDAARRQLAIQVEEFEQRADALEHERVRQAGGDPKPAG